MSYTQMSVDNDMSKLNTVFQTLVTNGIVGAVDYDSSGSYAVFTFYADAGKTTEIFRMTQSQSNSYVNGVKYTYRAAAADGTEMVIANPADTTQHSADTGSRIRKYNILRGYACENGVFILVGAGDNTASYWMSHSFIITRNQAGAPVFILTNHQTALTSTGVNDVKTNMNTEYIIAATDSAPLGSVARTAPAQREQTVLSPFFSCPDAGAVSYTPCAGRLLSGNMQELITSTRLIEMSFDNALWLTNGYWALKTGDAS